MKLASVMISRWVRKVRNNLLFLGKPLVAEEADRIERLSYCDGPGRYPYRYP